MAKKLVNLTATRRSLWGLLQPESGFLWVIVVYGLGISLLTLAVPIAVQTLINTIANIGSLRAVYVLAVTLFIILLASGVLSALSMWVVELYERKVYARLTAEMSYRVIRAPHQFFEGRSNAGITDRYFDIMILQKNVPRLLVDGFALVLQMLVGFTLVSFYHPWLFIFNSLTIATIYMIWTLWSRGAKRTAIELSQEKYATAKWLNDLEFAHEFFKSTSHVELAGRTTEQRTHHFIRSQAKHFRYTFLQSIMFLLVYALGSATLLGLGGWLVSNGQLSIGQLVAAELIMASVFLGLSRFASYLKSYYELYGAADKITELLSIPQEAEIAKDRKAPQSGAINFNEIVLKRDDRACAVNAQIANGSKVYVQANEAWVQRKVLNVLRFNDEPDSGWISLDGRSLADLDPFVLRQIIYSVDRSLIVECTIRDFLQLSAPNVGIDHMIRILTDVGLWQVISALPEKLDTRLSALGAPLHSVEVLLLKLAAAILSQPKVLVLNQRFDNVVGASRDAIMKVLEAQPFTILYFTSHPDGRFFDQSIQLTATDAEQLGKKTVEAAAND